MTKQKFNQSILITGASSGIGLDAAKTLHLRGYQVFATVRQACDIAQFKPLGITALQLDLTCKQSIYQALEDILKQTGGTLDFLFNNGAYGQPGAIEDLPTDVLREQFECNVFGWHQLTCEVLKVMRKQGHGRIVQNSSVLGLVCMPYRGAYNASKYAIEALTDTLRLELINTPIKISLLEPGPIVSNFRKTAYQRFVQNIDIEQSYHTEKYQQQISRLKSEENTTPFTLGPEAVTNALIHALESKKPRRRYSITFPTHLFSVLKRLLPTSVLDYLLAKG